VLGSTVAFGAAFAVVPPRTALYWYVFPLFGIAVPYLVEVRRAFTPRWWLTFTAAGVVSPIALDWAFSGHILWNVLLLGYVARTPARNTAWLPLFGASLVHLFALKAATQTGRDLVGGDTVRGTRRQHPRCLRHAKHWCHSPSRSMNSHAFAVADVSARPRARGFRPTVGRCELAIGFVRSASTARGEAEVCRLSRPTQSARLS